MKRVQRIATHQVGIVDIPEAQVREPDDVKIRVHYAAICTNDLMLWENQIRGKYANDGIGHEFSGVIADLGEEAKQFGLSVGDRVSGLSWHFCGKCPYCRGGKENMCINMSTFVGAMAEYIVIKDRMVCVLPDEISLEAGCLTEIVSTCLHGIDRIGIKPGDSVLIIGGGASGQVMVQLARMYGAGSITMCDRMQSKRLLAKRLGATHLIDREQDNLVDCANRITKSLGYQVIINISHDPSIVNLLPGLLSKGGSALLFTQYKPSETAAINLAELYVKECTLYTSYMAPYSLDRTMKVLPHLELNSLISHIMPLSSVQEAFELYAQGRCPRILLKLV